MDNGYKEALEQAERRRVRWFRALVTMSIGNLGCICVGVWLVFLEGFLPAIAALAIGIVAFVFSLTGAYVWSKRTPEGNGERNAL